MQLFGPGIIASLASAFICQAIELFPLRTKGILKDSRGNLVQSIFLGRKNLEVIGDEYENKNQVILCDICPVPLFEYADLSYSQFSQTSRDVSLCKNVVNRDQGIYDKLPYFWIKNTNVKKNFFDFMNGAQVFAEEAEYKLASASPSNKGPYSALNFCIETFLKANITGIIMEPVDESKSSIVLGSAVVISKHAYAQEWTLSATNQKLPKSRDNDVAIVCLCPLDEAVGLSLALNKPIYTTNTIYESLSVDAKLVQMGGREGGMNDMNEQKLTIYAEQKRVTSPAPSQQYDNREKDKISRADVKAAWEIFDPRTFLTMTVAQKRETLRVSGVTDLPRPREGEAELDRMLLDLADDAVRREVFRLKEQNMKQAKKNKNRFEGKWLITYK